MRSDDTIRLKHMLDASKEAINLSAEKTLGEADRDCR